MSRPLFCQLSPMCYRLSVQKERFRRRLSDYFSSQNFAQTFSEMPLATVIYRHRSLIRRRLGNVDLMLQDNKAVNLSLAAPKINGILIKPGETFSFWHLVGNCSAKRGYKEGLVIKDGQTKSGVGGGMCQFTNLLHWLILHSPLTITEHHHHDQFDLFPDYGRQVPFGVGTSIAYNYLDYRFRNDTTDTYQLLVSVDDEYLQGQLLAQRPLAVNYHIQVEDEHFTKEAEQIYRNSRIYRACIDKITGNTIHRQLIKTNHAKVLYPLTLEPSEKENSRHKNSQTP